MTPKTFFSYSRVDTEFTRNLATDLRNAGADLWIDQLDIQPGTRWDMEIEKALKESETIIVVLSPNAVASNNIMDEISYALENNKKVIPVIIEQCDIPFRIKRLQYIDFVQNYNTGFKRLSTVLKLDEQNPQAASSKADQPLSETQQKEHAGIEPIHSENTTSDHKHEIPPRKMPPGKKPLSKWIYFGAGAVALLIMLIFLFKSEVPSGNDIQNMSDSTTISTDNVPVSEPAVDSNTDSLVHSRIPAVVEEGK